MAASLCPRRTLQVAELPAGLASPGAWASPRPTPNKSPSPACARRRAGTARESAARGGAGSRAPGAGPGPGWRRPSSIPSRWEGMVESSRRGSGSLCREQPVFSALPAFPSRSLPSPPSPRPPCLLLPPSPRLPLAGCLPAASRSVSSGGARAPLRLAPPAASQPRCLPARLGGLSSPAPARQPRCRRSEQLSSACSGFGTRC